MSEYTAIDAKRRLALKYGLSALAGAPLLTSARVVFSADLPKVDVNDGTAKALGYVEDASTVDASERPDASRVCSTCMFYTEPEAEWGPCNLFPGKAVAGKGWCRSWVART